MSAPSNLQACTIQMITRNEGETRHVARRFAAALKPGDVVALEGDLGAGKTCFVRGLAEGLSIDPALVSSPTFVIAHEYAGSNVALAHIDAYRISTADDLETIGWSEMQRDDNLIIAIEWPSRISPWLPANRFDVHLQVSGETERTIRLSAPIALADRLDELSRARSEEMDAMQTKCRTCGRTISADAKRFPFCSVRCRMADLGGWFAGGFKMSRPVTNDDELE